LIALVENQGPEQAFTRFHELNALGEELIAMLRKLAER